MTDKQIMIDGCDVSGCEYIDKDSCCNLFEGLIGTPCSSYHFRNCHYKQLKRKEQECERLKEQIKKHNDDMFKNPPEKRFYCKGCTLPYISKKFKATLTEIKEIAITGLEGFCPKCSRKECEDNNCIETAIRDISEVLDENI